MSHRKIYEILDKHGLFYTKMSGVGYVLFFDEEDVFISHFGILHRTGAQSKRELLQYLDGVDMDLVALKMRDRTIECLYEREMDLQNRQISQDIQEEHAHRLRYGWLDNAWTRTELSDAISFYVYKA